MRIENLTPVEEQAYSALVDMEKEKVRPEAEAIKEDRIRVEAPKLAKEQSISIKEAAEVIRSRATGKLQPEDIVQFQSLGNVSVSAIIEDFV